MVIHFILFICLIFWPPEKIDKINKINGPKRLVTAPATPGRKTLKIHFFMMVDVGRGCGVEGSGSEHNMILY